LIDLHKELVETLKTILPTYYEMNLTSDTDTPCISYMEISNIPITAQHNPICTFGYSRVNMQVKVWGTNLATIQDYAKQIDNKLRPIGWKRTSSTELYDNQSSMIQKILGYEAIVKEEF
jgi:hypothetical protein